jgi:hypothetical protein
MRHETVQSVIQGLWLMQLALLAFLAFILITRKIWKSLPFFVAYALFNLLNGPIQFFLYRSPRFYVYSYIVTESLSVLLGLAVVYEIFVQLFSAHAALRRLATSLLALVVALLIALGIGVVYTHAPGLKNIAAGISASEQAARALEVGLLIFLFVCSGSFGLHWRQPLFGVAVGLVWFTTVQLIMMTVWMYTMGSSSGGIVSIVGMLTFNVSLLVWIGYMLAPERMLALAEMPAQSQLEQWNRAVMELIHQ